jgi:hypothetical protein
VDSDISKEIKWIALVAGTRKNAKQVPLCKGGSRGILKRR